MITILVFFAGIFAGWFLGNRRQYGSRRKNYDVYKRTNGLYEPVKRI